jgi:hypothetical protein
MNAQKIVPVIRPENPGLEKAIAILHEQQALRRLRRARRREVWRKVLQLALGWLKPVELVRQVGPHQPPQRRHEWNQREWRPLY